MNHRDELGAYLNAHGLFGHGVEVGVWEGEFSNTIMSNWHGERLYMVDVWSHVPGYMDWADVSNEAHRCRLLKAIDSVKLWWDAVRIVQEASTKASKLFDDGSLDFVYIDADHEYDRVCEDIDAWWPKVKEGGVLSGHDYMDAERTQMGITIKFGVKSAVDERFGDKVKVTQEENPSWWVFKK